jgi:hypothetical protein
MGYNFKIDGVYTVVCSDIDGELHFYVTEDAKSNFKSSKYVNKVNKPKSKKSKGKHVPAMKKYFKP